MHPQTIRARWIVPVSEPPIENGLLRLDAGRIISVERASPGCTADVDYGDAMILPGLVNSHTHLELSAFHQRVPFTGSFTDWIAALIALQIMQTPDDAARADAAFAGGLGESLDAGVTCVADIGCGETALRTWSRSPIGVVGFFEAIGMGSRRSDDHPRSLGRAIECCRRAGAVTPEQDGPARSSRRMFIACLSPHAPYSTAPEVYAEADAYCRARNLPITTHLAETREEAEFLSQGTGPFRTLLENLGLWDGSFEVPRCSPVQYARHMGLLDSRSLLAHVNYVSDEDIAILAGGGANVAYCPRTHRFFEHEPHRYRDMLAAGVNVCVGTDSPASAPSVSILEELRYLRSIDDATPDAVILEMGTLRGAAALGLEHERGSLAPGKRADFVVLPVRNGSIDPLEELLRDSAAPRTVWVDGRPAVSRPGA